MPSKRKSNSAKWVLQPNPPPHPSQEFPLAYTTFCVPPPINVKNQTSSYLKSEGQTWLARAAAAPAKRRKLDGSGSSSVHASPDKSKAPMRDAEVNGLDEGLEGEIAAREQQAKTIIIHPGSQYLRIGRATDLFPISIPNVIARKERPTPYQLLRRTQQPSNGLNGGQVPNGVNSPATNGHAQESSSAGMNSMQVDRDEQYGDENDGSADPSSARNGNGRKKDPLTEKIDVLRLDLRSIMRTNKFRPVTNGRGLTASYNESVQAERIPEHNDVYRGDWTDGETPPEKSFYIGEAALQLPEFSVPASKEAEVRARLAATWSEPHWRLFRPFKRALLNHDAYAEVYGPQIGLQALLTDVEQIWTHALTAAPEDPNQPSASGTVDYGLGIPRSEWATCNVILIVPDLYSRGDIRALIELCLGPMGFAAVCVQSEGVATTFGAGISSGCIVDIGLERIGISCIEEGLVLPETRIALDYGGSDLTAFFEVLLHRSNMPYRDLNGSKRITDNILAESLKERLCTLNPADLGLNISDFLLSLPKQPTLKYMLRTYDEIILGPMTLFTPRVVDFDAKTGWRSVEASGGRAGMEDAEEFSVVLGGEAEARDVEPVVTLAMQHCCRHLLAPPAAPTTTTAENAVSMATGSGGSGLVLGFDSNGMQLAMMSPGPGMGYGGGPGTAPGTAAVSRSGTPGIPASSPAVERMFTLGGSGLGTEALGGQPPMSARATPAPVPTPSPPKGPAVDIPREASKMPLDIAVWASIVASGSSTGGQLTSVGINTVGGAAGEERIKKMSSNVIVSGGTAQIPGLGIALELRINQHFSDWLAQLNAAAQAAAQAHFQATGQHGGPSMTGTGSSTATTPTNLQARATVVPPQRDIDPRVLPWKGMSVFARLECANDLWLRAEDWEALGWRAAKDKILFL
ncbi:hypothetical protein A4X13_0g7115 [Tilletia indica]|uniref:Uncharacterized protein n=1 Tax=Tilletia indica TaxID=43049 RepID=A0A177TNL9_9BASI|nr:hypothetical protein A4X13_0g7115 [Tilletia indica]